MFSLALTFFLIANPMGNSPAIIAVIKDFDFARQKIILLREGLISLSLALFFQYFGELFLGALNINDFVVTITGGLLLLFLAFRMIFPRPPSTDSSAPQQEPFIVPIATPLIAGPGLLSVIMMYAKQEQNDFKITMAILIAWVGVFFVFAIAPYLQRVLGQRGMVALEQVMGMLLALVSMELLLKGSAALMKTLILNS